jgi:hypothetical protein
MITCNRPNIRMKERVIFVRRGEFLHLPSLRQNSIKALAHPFYRFYILNTELNFRPSPE